MRQATLARKLLPGSMPSTRPVLISWVQERPVRDHIYRCSLSYLYRISTSARSYCTYSPVSAQPISVGYLCGEPGDFASSVVVAQAPMAMAAGRSACIFQPVA